MGLIVLEADGNRWIEIDVSQVEGSMHTRAELYLERAVPPVHEGLSCAHATLAARHGLTYVGG